MPGADLEVRWSELVVAAAAPPQPRMVNTAGEPRRVNNLTLIDGKSFFATTLSGDIAPPGATDVGLFHQDTRFLSHWELRVNGHRTVVLSAASQRNILAQIELTTPGTLVRDNLDLPENTVHIHREQLLAGHFFDRLTFHNFNLQPVALQVELCFDADFMDVFQVRGMLRPCAGTYFEPALEPHAVVFAYLGRDEWRRQVSIGFSPAPRLLQPRRAEFALRLAPGARQTLQLVVATAAGPA
ncbi:MAG: glycogen debranching N-terminal domain-containing protein, partial [Terriglobales bacterium]